MVRGPYFDKNGLKKGAWSKEEDDKLRAYVRKYGHWNWRQLPKFAGLQRCGKSCRIRWLNYLRPDVKHGGYSKEEEDLIIQLYDQLGSKWSKIAEYLPGRTDNEIKNYWHTHLKKRGEKNQRQITIKQGLESEQKIESSPNEGTIQNLTQEKEPEIADPTLSIPTILESSSLVSPSTSCSTALPQYYRQIEEDDDDKLKAHVSGHGVSNGPAGTLVVRPVEAPQIHEIIKNEDQFIMGYPNFLLMDDTNFPLLALPESSPSESSSFLCSDVNFMVDATNSMDWIVDEGSNTLAVLESDFWTEPFVLDLDISDGTKYESSMSLNSLSWELNYFY